MDQKQIPISAMPPTNRRQKLLISPELQLKLILLSFALCLLTGLVQAAMSAISFTSSEAYLAAQEAGFRNDVPGLLVDNLLITMGLMFPITMGIGLVLTHRIYGPIYRFEQYLGQLARGEATSICRIREKDEFQNLCGLLNDAVEPLIQKNARTKRAADKAAKAREAAEKETVLAGEFGEQAEAEELDTAA